MRNPLTVTPVGRDKNDDGAKIEILFSMPAIPRSESSYLVVTTEIARWYQIGKIPLIRFVPERGQMSKSGVRYFLEDSHARDGNAFYGGATLTFAQTHLQFYSQLDKSSMTALS